MRNPAPAADMLGERQYGKFTNTRPSPRPSPRPGEPRRTPDRTAGEDLRFGKPASGPSIAFSRPSAAKFTVPERPTLTPTQAHTPLLVDILKSNGFNTLSNLQVLKAIFGKCSALGEAVLGDCIVFMVQTYESEDLPLVSISAICDKLGIRNPIAGAGPQARPSQWNITNFSVAASQFLKRPLAWEKIFPKLDTPKTYLQTNSFLDLISAFSQTTQSLALFPFHSLLKKWKNPKSQLAFILCAVSLTQFCVVKLLQPSTLSAGLGAFQQISTIADILNWEKLPNQAPAAFPPSFNYNLLTKKTLKSAEFGPNAIRQLLSNEELTQFIQQDTFIWRSIDFVLALFDIYEAFSEMNSKKLGELNGLMQNAMKACPAQMALTFVNLPSDHITKLNFASARHEQLLAELVQVMIIEKRPIYKSTVGEIWKLNSNFVLRAMAQLYFTNPDNSGRILDMLADMKGLYEALEHRPFSFTLDLATLACGRSFVNMGLWLNDQILRFGIAFVEEACEFLIRKIVTINMSNTDVLKKPVFQKAFRYCTQDSTAPEAASLQPPYLSVSRTQISEAALQTFFQILLFSFNIITVMTPHWEVLKPLLSLLYSELYFEIEKNYHRIDSDSELKMETEKFYKPIFSRVSTFSMHSEQINAAEENKIILNVVQDLLSLHKVNIRNRELYHIIIMELAMAVTSTSAIAGNDNVLRFIGKLFGAYIGSNLLRDRLPGIVFITLLRSFIVGSRCELLIAREAVLQAIEGTVIPEVRSAGSMHMSPLYRWPAFVTQLMYLPAIQKDVQLYEKLRSISEFQMKHYPDADFIWKELRPPFGGIEAELRACFPVSYKGGNSYQSLPSEPALHPGSTVMLQPGSPKVRSTTQSRAESPSASDYMSDILVTEPQAETNISIQFTRPEIREPPVLILKQINFLMNNATSENVEETAQAIVDKKIFPKFSQWFCHCLIRRALNDDEDNSSMEVYSNLLLRIDEEDLVANFAHTISSETKSALRRLIMRDFAPKTQKDFRSIAHKFPSLAPLGKWQIHSSFLNEVDDNPLIPQFALVDDDIEQIMKTMGVWFGRFTLALNRPYVVSEFNTNALLIQLFRARSNRSLYYLAVFVYGMLSACVHNTYVPLTSGYCVCQLATLQAIIDTEPASSPLSELTFENAIFLEDSGVDTTSSSPFIQRVKNLAETVFVPLLSKPAEDYKGSECPSEVSSRAVTPNPKHSKSIHLDSIPENSRETSPRAAFRRPTPSGTPPPRPVESSSSSPKHTLPPRVLPLASNQKIMWIPEIHSFTEPQLIKLQVSASFSKLNITIPVIPEITSVLNCAAASIAQISDQASPAAREKGAIRNHESMAAAFKLFVVENMDNSPLCEEFLKAPSNCVENMETLNEECLRLNPSLHELCEELTRRCVIIMKRQDLSSITNASMSLAREIVLTTYAKRVPSFSEFFSVFTKLIEKLSKTLTVEKVQPLIETMLNEFLCLHVVWKSAESQQAGRLVLESIANKFSRIGAEKVAEFVSVNTFKQALLSSKELIHTSPQRENCAPYIRSFKQLFEDASDTQLPEFHVLADFLGMNDPNRELRLAVPQSCIPLFEAVQTPSVIQRIVKRSMSPHFKLNPAVPPPFILPSLTKKTQPLIVKILEQSPTSSISTLFENIMIAWNVNTSIVDFEALSHSIIPFPFFVTQRQAANLPFKEVCENVRQVFEALNRSVTDLCELGTVSSPASIANISGSDPINVAITQVSLISQASFSKTTAQFFLQLVVMCISGALGSDPKMLLKHLTGRGMKIPFEQFAQLRDEYGPMIFLKEKIDKAFHAHQMFLSSVCIAAVAAIYSAVKTLTTSTASKAEQSIKSLMIVSICERVKAFLATPMQDYATNKAMTLFVEQVQEMVFYDLFEPATLTKALDDALVFQNPRASNWNSVSLLAQIALAIWFKPDSLALPPHEDPLQEFLIQHAKRTVELIAASNRATMNKLTPSLDDKKISLNQPTAIPESLAAFLALMQFCPTPNEMVRRMDSALVLSSPSPYGPILSLPSPLPDIVSKLDAQQTQYREAWNANLGDIGNTAKILMANWCREYRAFPSSHQVRHVIISRYMKYFRALGLGVSPKTTRVILKSCFASALEESLKRRDLLEKLVVEHGICSDLNKALLRIDEYAALILEFVPFIRELLPDSTEAANAFFAAGFVPVLTELRTHAVDCCPLDQLFLYRFFTALILAVSSPRRFATQLRLDFMHSITGMLHLLSPRCFPSYYFTWLGVVTSADFIGSLLDPQQVTPAQRRVLRQDFLSLLMELFRFLSVFSRRSEESSNFIHCSVFRFVLIIVHDFPNFLMENYLQICSALPPDALQIRNLVLSAFPTAKPPPSPFKPSLKVYRIPEMREAPALTLDFRQALHGHGVLGVIDQFIGEIGVPQRERRMEELTDWLLARMFAHDGDELVTLVPFYLGVCTAEIMLREDTRGVQDFPSYLLLLALVEHGGEEQCYRMLYGLVDHLRCPNLHTYIFSLIILSVYNNTSSMRVREQVLRVLAERILIARPQPWGLLVAFLELLRNRKYALWAHPAIAGAPLLRERFEEFSRAAHAKK
eukprot:gnl/Chilomastix_cuspidata/345.p1 GENE.gnl/Chilomastix_cuspidata/345~~gnl/Chilomastix_cuspidata/345.p1  ORF type:complete len:2824 (-),score=715.97 gnl/Chilomastix_cuspidata/345:2707-10419(-)